MVGLRCSFHRLLETAHLFCSFVPKVAMTEDESRASCNDVMVEVILWIN